MTTTDASDPMVGRLVDDRYRIVRRLARGGMAVVYVAEDLRLARTVALKMMYESLGHDPDFVRRFDVEARSAARLVHPHVVGVFDQGVDGDRPYLVMEYVDGPTLRSVVTDQAPLDPSRAVGLMIQVAEGVAAAHEAGIIHRDLKPENILVAAREQLKVADFGLARAVTATTASGFSTLLGTVSYAAPEVVTEGQADTRSDVYALGVILYELLTGRQPHTGETPLQVAYSHVHTNVAPPSSVGVPGIPDYLDALVLAATAREPSQRLADAGVLLARLRQVRDALAAGVQNSPLLAAQQAAVGLGPDETATQHLASPRPGATVAVPNTTAKLAPVVVARKRRRRRLLPLLAVLLILGLLGGAGSWYLLEGRFTTMPALAGLTEAEAVGLAKDHHLTVHFNSDFSETVPAGKVISSDPDAGVRVISGGEVSAYLSKGPERYTVPKLAGTPAADAAAALSNAHLALGTPTEVWSDTVAAGIVISSDPDAGASVKSGTGVNLTVSKGPQPVTVVSYVGKPLAEAKAFYEGAGLKVAVSAEQNDDRVPSGSVISQDPASGTVAKGGTVSFVVSKGPVMVAVPKITGLAEAAAVKAITNAGLKAKVSYRSKYLMRATNTNPAEGTLVPKGSAVTIFIV